jgi:hypothetical protein
LTICYKKGTMAFFKFRGFTIVTLTLEKAKVLLNKLRDASPEQVFATLNEELKVEKCGTLSQRYRAIARLIHPDKIQDEALKEDAQTIMQILNTAYQHLSGGYGKKTMIIDPLVWELSLETMQWDAGLGARKKALNVLEALLSPNGIPYEPISDDIWESAQENFTRIIKNLDEKDKNGELNNRDGSSAEQSVFRNKEEVQKLITDGRARSKKFCKEKNLPEATRENFINAVLLPDLKKMIKSRANGAESGDRSFLGAIKNCLNGSLAVFRFDDWVLNDKKIHPFIKFMRRKEREVTRNELMKELNSGISIMTYLEQMTKELQNTIDEHYAQYAGVLGRIRFWYRSNYDPSWEEEKKVIKGLEWALSAATEGMKNLNLFHPCCPLIGIPKSNDQVNSSLSIALRRLEEIKEIYKPEYCNLSHTLKTYQKLVQLKEKSSLFKERGVFGFFGAYGRTRASERCLHQLKGIMLDQITDSLSNKQKTEIVKAFAEHNGRWWRVGQTATEKAFEGQELVSSYGCGT